MSYERVLVNQWAREMNNAAMNIAHAIGAGKRATETACSISPEMGQKNETFFSEMGLMPKIGAIGSYIGSFMYDVYDDEVQAAIDYGYNDAAGMLRK
jgi:hypothetical protein